MPSRDRSLLLSAAAAVHKLIGGFCFRLDRFDRARRHFERVIELKGDDFAAYVYLGRVAYRLGDYAGWQRECGHAQRTSPERYARLKHPFELYEPRSAGSLFETGERTTWRSLRASSIGAGREALSVQPHAEAVDAEPCPEGPLRRYGDDFVSDAERERFRSLTPIRVDEVRSTDLDELTRRLGS